MNKITVWFLILLVAALGFILLRDTSEEVAIDNPPEPVGADAPASAGGSLDARTKFTGIVRTGVSQGEVKKHCANGLYLELDPGLQMNARQTLLLLKDSTGAMITNSTYVGKRVTITGRYPAENATRCEALICGCEEYLVAERITID